MPCKSFVILIPLTLGNVFSLFSGSLSVTASLADSVKSFAKDTHTVMTDSAADPAPDTSRPDSGAPAVSGGRIDSMHALKTSDSLREPQIEKPDAVSHPKAHRSPANLIQEISKRSIVLVKYLKHLLILLISITIISGTILFYQRKADGKRFMTSTRLSVMDPEVQRACKYIENRFADPELTLEKICESLVTGPAFLEALFARELGMNVSTFLSHVRINRAGMILKKNSCINSDEIIYQIGMTNHDQFLAQFKSITGVSFKEYQDSLLVPESKS